MIVDRGTWTNNAAPIACLCQNKVMFLLKIILIYDEPQYCHGQPPLSGHLPVLQG